MAIWLAILSLICVIAVIGWIKYKISLMALTAYLLKKEYTPPSEDEIKACTEYVIKNLLKDWCSR